MSILRISSEIFVCDCHTWPTVGEMHDYVEALERKIRILEDLAIQRNALLQKYQEMIEGRE